jgi:hypothetical protein
MFTSIIRGRWLDYLEVSTRMLRLYKYGKVLRSFLLADFKIGIALNNLVTLRSFDVAKLISILNIVSKWLFSLILRVKGIIVPFIFSSMLSYLSYIITSYSLSS